MGVNNLLRSIHYLVHKLYIDSVGGISVPTSTRNSPTFEAKLFDSNQVPIELPVLDSVAVVSEDLSKLYIYLVNRSLTDDVDVQIFLENTPSPIDSIVADTITADDFTAENTLAQPNAVEIVNTVLAVNKADISLRMMLEVRNRRR